MLKTTATFGAFLRLWGVRITPIISKAQKARKRPHLSSDSACSSLSCPLSTLLVASFHIKGLIKSQKKVSMIFIFREVYIILEHQLHRTICISMYETSLLLLFSADDPCSWHHHFMTFHLLKTTCRTINSTILYWSCLLQRVYEILLFASFKWSVQIINH